MLRGVPVEDLTAVDHERLAVAGYLMGFDDASVTAWEWAHRRHLDAGDIAEAGRCAFWAACCLLLQGRMAHAGGWLQRAESTIGDDRACAAWGLLRIPALLEALGANEPERARDLAIEAGDVATRSGDRDLWAFATLGHGQALLAMGDQPGGIARLDAVMLSVTSNEVGPIVSGIVYCAVVLECMQLFDLARAAEWTDVLDQWCSAQPDLVPYRGQCMVHQSQLQQATGRWEVAAATAAAARRRLSDPPHPALGLACYQQAELCRLRGDLGGAAEAYRDASRSGYAPMPGLARLALARGDLDGATSSIRRALVEAGQPFQRPGLLDAAVDILLAAADVDGARAAANELRALATAAHSQVLGAMSDHAEASTLLAEGDAASALARARRASATWQRLRMPYPAARAAELIGRGCLALGDRATAALELDNAREAFASLGASLDAERLAGLLAAHRRGGRRTGEGILSDREVEVLAEVAAGKTNREVAESLMISQHTVGRHLENVFAKLGVGTRAAAIAHAYEHDLL